MDRLNYHHLLYFWLVARERGLANACAKLRLSPSTISGQIHALEHTLDQKLFRKKGRRLELTDMGRIVYRYADEIFTLGKELQDAIHDRPVGKPFRLQVGIVDVVPKLVAKQMLAPALAIGTPIHLICVEDRLDRLMTALSMHELDVVLADSVSDSSATIKAFNHLIIDCPVAILGAKKLHQRYHGKFPRSLRGAPLLLPTVNTALRRSMDHWLSDMSMMPQIMGEFDDRALLEVFGELGMGLFPVPSLLADTVCKQLNVQKIGVLKEIRERFYAITVERRVTHPGVAAICDAGLKSDRV
jgi:LysR family transcriptional regulator, transcriptional activator of nhaA